MNKKLIEEAKRLDEFSLFDLADAEWIRTCTPIDLESERLWNEKIGNYWLDKK